MATALEDHQFELLASEDFSEGAAFGIGLAVSCNADGFDPGANDWLVQDQDDPFSGATRVGRDVRKGPTWTWALHVNMEDEEGALEALETLAEAWAPEESNTPGSVSILRYKVGGRVRRVYGRPRRFAAPPDNRILGGFVPVTADFKLVDALYYGDSVESVTLGVAYTSAGGFVFPVTFPVMTAPGGFTPGQAVVTGRRRTYPVIRINGPIINPEVQADNWNLRLNATIAEGDWIEIDTRPWKKTIVNSSGGSVPGLLSAQTSLRQLYLNPGSQSFGFRGISGEGTATCTISWYPAFASL